MKISEIIADKYKLRIPPTVYYDLLADVQEAEEPTTKNDLGVDCISRADAIRVASGYCHPSNVAKELAKLPSVTPQEPKTGHWREDIDNNRRWDRVRFYCSECGDWQIYGKTHYCPNCGAKMQSEAE